MSENETTEEYLVGTAESPVVVVAGRDLVNLAECLLTATSKGGYVRLKVDDGGIKCAVNAAGVSGVWTVPFGGVDLLP